MGGGVEGGKKGWGEGVERLWLVPLPNSPNPAPGFETKYTNPRLGLGGLAFLTSLFKRETWSNTEKESWI